ncbi:hypothetical protein F441_18655 [Phytophthora nicotianae CJ01A1]|uniref:Uncharacterized protein n=3 Tax=Phytophthora nicotianae TaxID=4792 RepID=V9E8Y5_PHYNI|nr:hypothetical protein F443_18803 [Phytophthora nicotianae P1569]ETK75060.1 hypothetical protein L915_18271 [Phytophthora nicotianae]ETL28481.1 hypothetical protein L916_18180 [Phytophthora nicotianae]ETP04584.1 hypothetical protein F441_18655 [Phytophthora nicotianae CJ01A1]
MREGDVAVGGIQTTLQRVKALEGTKGGAFPTDKTLFSPSSLQARSRSTRQGVQLGIRLRDDCRAVAAAVEVLKNVEEDVEVTWCC